MALDMKRLMAIGAGAGKKPKKKIEEPAEDDGLEYGEDDDLEDDESDEDFDSEEPVDSLADTTVSDEQIACAADVRTALKSNDDAALAEALLALLEA